jgi:undecaprenyl diphosphate synthase
MKQRALLPTAAGLHVGIIMDGNGRWATGRGHPRASGHAEGARAVVRAVEAAPALGIGVLTLYAFSSDNWRRPPREVASLMRLFRKYLHAETARCVETGVRLTIVGRRDRLGTALRRAIELAEQATARGTTLDLRIAIDYSGRDAIVRAAAASIGHGELTTDRFSEQLAAAYGGNLAVPDVDLLIRTGGEQRVSDFLLWESAYAELYFTARMWPEFGAADLGNAVRAFHSRERRVGGLAEAVAG